MKDFIKQYSEWKFILESEGDTTSDAVEPATISSTIIKGIVNKRINNRLITRVNTEINKAVGEYKGKVQRFNIPIKNTGLNPINIYHGINKASIKKLTATNEDGSEGELIGNISGWAQISSDRLNKMFNSSKPRTCGISIKLTATYKIDVATDEFTFKITGAKPRADKDFAEGPFKILNINVKISGDTLSIIDLSNAKQIFSSNQLGLTSEIIGKGGSFNLDKAMASI
jgi:hypothetical protein